MQYVIIFSIFLIAVVFMAALEMFNSVVDATASSPTLFLFFVVLLFIAGLYLLTRQVRKRYEELEISLFDKQDSYQKRRDQFLNELKKRSENLDLEVKRKVKNATSKKWKELSDKLCDVEKKEDNLECEIKTRVGDLVAIREQKMKVRDEAFQNSLENTRRRVQRLIDSSYKFKTKTLLASISLKNQHTKLEQLVKEKKAYLTLQADIEYLELLDNSDWKRISHDFYEKLELLERAQSEREIQSELKRQMREEKQREEELLRRQKEAAEEEDRLAEQQAAITEALLLAEGEHRAELEQQRAELSQKIEDVHKQYERAKSMAQMTKQGHVYVISNIGSFGENVFKVGMTRRLEPMDRVKELGDASVPFEFDVHAMISCDDAPALEKSLHTSLAKYQVNKVNSRKEFFRVELNSIIGLVEKNYGQVEYVADPVALQYYKTLEIENEENLVIA